MNCDSLENPDNFNSIQQFENDFSKLTSFISSEAFSYGSNFSDSSCWTVTKANSSPVIALIYFILCTTGAVGNLLMLYLLTLQIFNTAKGIESLRSKIDPKVFIVLLCFADLVFIASDIPLNINHYSTSHGKYWTLGWFNCKFLHFLSSTAKSCSCLVTTVIAIHRFATVSKRFLYLNFKYFLLVTFLLSMGLNWYEFYQYNLVARNDVVSEMIQQASDFIACETKNLNTTNLACNIELINATVTELNRVQGAQVSCWPSGHPERENLIFFFNTLNKMISIFLPTLIITFCYIFITLNLKKQGKIKRNSAVNRMNSLTATEQSTLMTSVEHSCPPYMNEDSFEKQKHEDTELIKRVTLIKHQNAKTISDSEKTMSRLRTLTHLIIVVFIVCWLPTSIFEILQMLRVLEFNQLTWYVKMVTQILAYSNASLSPLLYVMSSIQFKESLRRFLQNIFQG